MTLFVFVVPALDVRTCSGSGHPRPSVRSACSARCSLLATLGLGAGFFFASLEPIVPSVKNIAAQVLGRPLYFSSGLFFTADTLPTAVPRVPPVEPVLHMLELLRSEFFYGFDTNDGSWLYAGSWSAGFLALGLVTHRATRKKAIVTK